MSLLDLATAKNFAQISHTKEDTVLQIVLDSVEEFISSFCAIRLNATADDNVVTENIDGGGRYLWPMQHPITAFSEADDCSITDRMITSDNEYDLANTFFNKNRIWKINESSWRPGSERWRVVYKAGYVADTLPSGIKLEILNLFARAYSNRGGEASGSVMGYRTDWQEFMDSDMIIRLRAFSFRRPIS